MVVLISTLIGVLAMMLLLYARLLRRREQPTRLAEQIEAAYDIGDFPTVFEKCLRLLLMQTDGANAVTHANATARSLGVLQRLFVELGFDSPPRFSSLKEQFLNQARRTAVVKLEDLGWVRRVLEFGINEAHESGTREIDAERMQDLLEEASSQALRSRLQVSEDFGYGSGHLTPLRLPGGA